MHSPDNQRTAREQDYETIESELDFWGVPSFGSLSFQDAVRLFSEWGFQVEPGPRSAEVTLIQIGADYQSYGVYDVELLPAMAAAALRVRWINGTLTRRPEQEGAPHRAIGHHDLARVGIHFPVK